MTSGACCSKVPKLFRPISGVTIPFIPSQRRDSKPSNFSYIKSMSKDQLLTTSGLQFDNWLFGTFDKQSPCQVVKMPINRNGSSKNFTHPGDQTPTRRCFSWV